MYWTLVLCGKWKLPLYPMSPLHIGDSTIIGDPLLAEDGSEGARASAIWCLTVKDGLIIAGCGNGRIEVQKENLSKLNLLPSLWWVYQCSFMAACKQPSVIHVTVNFVALVRSSCSFLFLDVVTSLGCPLTPRLYLVKWLWRITSAHNCRCQT